MRLLITGAAGKIGREMVSELAQTHEVVLLDRIRVPGRESLVADVSQTRRGGILKLWSRSSSFDWTRAFTGVQAIVHLAAETRHRAMWETVLSNNVRGTWNVLEAAVEHGVPRVVFASSNWSVKATEQRLGPECYLPGGPKIDSDSCANPLKPYGVSKAFGELAGRMFVNEGRLRAFLAVRIGYFNPTPPVDEDLRCRWIGVDDIRSLFRRCIEAEVNGYHVVYGVSGQSSAPYDLSHTRELLSWEPRQNALDP